MSFQAMSLAAAVPLKAAQKSLLFVIANYTNDECLFWPSYQTLADQAGLSRRTAMRYIQEFCEMGLIKKRKRVKEDNQKQSDTNCYRYIVASWLSNNGYVVTLTDEGGIKIAKPKAEKEAESSGDTQTPPSDTQTLPQCQPDTTLVSPCHQGSVTVSPNTITDTINDTINETNTLSESGDLLSVQLPMETPKEIQEGKYYSILDNRTILLPEFPNNKTKSKSDRSQCVEIPSWIDFQLITEFVNYREGMGKYLSGRALSQLINKLSDFEKQGYHHSQALCEAMGNGWQSPYMPKPNFQSKQAPQFNDDEDFYDVENPFSQTTSERYA